MDLGLHGVHVLVIGASGGIGFEVTKLFLGHGACVSAHYNTQPESLLEIKAKTPDRLSLLQADITDEQAVKKMFEDMEQSFHQEAQVLILCHGVWTLDDIDLIDMSLLQWKRTVDINMTGSFLISREFLRRLRAPRPSREPDMSKVAIVVIGSTCATYGEEGHIDYACASSGLQFGFVQTLKYELVKIAPEGRVNAVSPGWVNTGMAKSLLSDKTLLQRTLAATPLKRIATSLDVATQVVLLASSTASRHMTGTSISLAGGLDGRVDPEPVA